MIQIANWLLTRRCNLSCSYCAIARNYDMKPALYPDMKYYSDHEMSTQVVINNLKRLKIHNPNMFHIFYGGEPLVRKDIKEIVKFCNDNNIFYTIITNNSQTVQPIIKELVFDNGSKLSGITSSVDPVIMIKDYKDKDRQHKSIDGLKRLEYWKQFVDDAVAEITVDNETIDYLIPLVSSLTEKGISSSITFIDIARNPYYDFSNITEPDLLVKPTEKVKTILNELTHSKYDVHMARTLMPKIYDILPSNMDCEIEKDIHNITIDADGSIRLCIRIRGIETPKFGLCKYINDDGKINIELYKHITNDKKNYCQGCNWTCMLMSGSVSTKNDVDNLIHSDRR